LGNWRVKFDTFKTAAVLIKPIRVLSLEWNGALQKLEAAKVSKSKAQKI
jgi:hypothetical protein